eukprot:m.199784 g.199784  ORF g.199784 m.199784 type:complete len:110 (+) comp25925_c1_seq4:370-699(+)
MGLLSGVSGLWLGIGQQKGTVLDTLGCHSAVEESFPALCLKFIFDNLKEMEAPCSVQLSLCCNEETYFSLLDSNACNSRVRQDMHGDITFLVMAQHTPIRFSLCHLFPL